MTDGDVQPSKWMSRKFWLAVLAVSSCTGLVWFGHIADGVYSAVMIATVAGYLAANVTQKFTVEKTQ